MANPEGKGGFKKGQSGNPGGLTKEARAARDLLTADLSSEEMRVAWRAGYAKALSEGNALILADYLNRTLGKPVESVSIEANVNNENPAAPLTTEQLVAIAQAAGVKT